MPFIVGFGINSSDDVEWFNNYSDGAVVGSAILKKVLDDPTNKPVYNFVKNLKGTLNENWNSRSNRKF